MLDGNAKNGGKTDNGSDGHRGEERTGGKIQGADLTALDVCLVSDVLVCVCVCVGADV